MKTNWKRALAYKSTLLIGLAAAALPATAAEKQFAAAELLSKAVTTHLQLTANGKALELQRGELIEDDGPAAGYSYQANVEKLTAEIHAKKVLLLEDPSAERAMLLVGGSGKLQATVNGSSKQLLPTGKAGAYWQTYELPTSLLKSGANKIVLQGEGNLWIAREEDFPAGSRTRTSHANRSAKSTDGGQTWNDRQLGTDGKLDGEYYVRLFLDRYRRAGSLVLPVVDVGNLAGRKVAPALKSMGPIRLRLQSTQHESGSITLRQRTGSQPVPGEGEWSQWQAVEPSSIIENPQGRYLQLSIEVTTNDPRKSPLLHKLTIAAEPVASKSWGEMLNVQESHNQPIVRSSIPFEYEPFDRPELATLRQRYELDEVTEGSASEFELIQRLAAWSALRPSRIGHLSEAYPPWNALEILQEHDDGTLVGGFCQQYNLVFLQACESYGLVGRAVSLGPGTYREQIRSGHEVVEIWSNQFAKWIYVDGNYGWYFEDQQTGTPLSLLQLRERQLAALQKQPHEPVRLKRIIDTGQAWDGLTSKPPFIELRLIPRSNFLQAKSPLPLNQGMRGWFWTGHFIWTDSLAPATKLLGHRVTNRSNWEWTLNQAHYRLVATEEPAVLQVYLDTQTPHFDTFMAKIDGAEQIPVKSGFRWKLQAGENRLEVVSRNKAGRQGSTSWVVLEYLP